MMSAPAPTGTAAVRFAATPTLAPGVVPTRGARRTKFDFLINFLSLPPAAGGPIAQQALYYLDGTLLRYARSRAVIFSPILIVVKFVLEK
jgi:hypothetical protein